MGRIPEGTPEDVDRAVAAARAAFETWSQTPLEERAELCAAIAGGLAARGDEIAALISQELGMPIELSTAIQAGLPTMTFGSMPQLVEEVAWEEQVGNSLVVREPVGVVGAITPWNYPLHQIAAKVAPALAAGCTVVLKPSEVAPLNAFVLAEIIDEVGLPAGRLQPRHRAPARSSARRSPRTPASTWSRSPARRARASASASSAAQTVKRVALELGGKSPNVILDDADLEKAVTDGVAKCFLNSGQTCSALTRMLVPRDAARGGGADRRGGRRARSRSATRSTRTRELGPLVSDVQRERVRGYIQKGVEEGAKLVTGGAEPPEGLDRGYFVRPTVFADVTQRHDDRAGGDLRPGAVDHPLRRRGRRGPDRQRLRLRPRRRRVVRRRGARASASRAGSAPARSRSTAASSTRSRRSAATSSRATAASSGSSGSRSSSRSSRCSCDVKFETLASGFGLHGGALLGIAPAAFTSARCARGRGMALSPGWGAEEVLPSGAASGGMLPPCRGAASS